MMVSSLQNNVSSLGSAYMYGQTNKAETTTDATKPDEKKEQSVQKSSAPVQDGERYESVDGDIMDISNSGAANLHMVSSVDGSSNTESAEGKTATSEAESKTASTAKANASQQAAVQDEESDEVDTDDLSQYSTSELKLMWINGDITRSEYEEELAGRSNGIVVDEE